MAEVQAPITGSLTIDAGPAVQLGTASQTVPFVVKIKADARNAGRVFVGFSIAVTADSNPATDGMEIPTDVMLEIPQSAAKNLGSIWLVSDSDGQEVFFMVN